jgi:hypothetical protein
VEKSVEAQEKLHLARQKVLDAQHVAVHALYALGSARTRAEYEQLMIERINADRAFHRAIESYIALERSLS